MFPKSVSGTCVKANEIKPMTTPYQIRTTQISILPSGDPLISEQATKITIVEEGAGEHLEIEQQMDTASAMCQTIKVETDEWPKLKEGVEMMLKEIQKHRSEDK